MLYFENDYSEGAHEKVLERLIETNMEQLPGYGTDHYSDAAKEKIRSACGCPDADVYFLTGGTQTNAVVIGSMLDCHEGVIAADTGHIGSHEAGAVEYTGHKVLSLPHEEGKLSACELKTYIENFFGDENREHMVFPGMVYISHPTEYGTLYTKRELAELADICAEYHIPLYLDGARLGYALASEETDVTLKEIAEYCDVFYIGGTKVGALCGEAIVFTRGNTPVHFITKIKQKGALLAKGRLTGIQFDALFTDDLYIKISRNAIQTAEALRNVFQRKGYEFYLDTPANQIFIVLKNTDMERLRSKVAFSYWEKKDDTHTIVRFATSWATKMEAVEQLEKIL